ncbi:transposase [Micromonospora sp. NPDC020750]|uniref:transposase n=1 Tax=unclassified Micromonospora TaxID=2617518 RepID=UPI0037AF85F6
MTCWACGPAAAAKAPSSGLESLNARFRQAARRRGHFPTEQAAMEVLYLVVQQKRKGGGNRHPPVATAAGLGAGELPEVVVHQVATTAGTTVKALYAALCG